MSTTTRLKNLERRLADRRELKSPSTELFISYPGDPGRDADGLTAEDAARLRDAEERGARVVVIRVLRGRGDDASDAGAGVEKK